MQYTIRGISDELDRVIREYAKREGVSLNEAVVRALRSGLGVETHPSQKRDFAAVFKGEPLEPEVEKALEEQRQIDWEMWPGLKLGEQPRDESA
ncbi:MAG: hypothetical protein AAF790_05475 [Planctomycetota bacterium]